MKMEMKAWWSRWCDHAIMKGSVTAIYQEDRCITAEIVTVDSQTSLENKLTHQFYSYLILFLFNSYSVS